MAFKLEKVPFKESTPQKTRECFFLRKHFPEMKCSLSNV